MRDVERLREKHPVFLESRQALALSLCALLLLGGVFSLGVLIGRKTASAPASAAPAGELAGLDAQARKPVPPPPLAKASPAPPAASAPEPAAAGVEKPEPPRAATVVVPPPPARSATMIPAPLARPLQVPAPAAAPLTAPPRDVGTFTVQVGASQDRGEAARLESRVRSAGLRPYVVQANLGAKGTWYRIRVGAFRDKDAAARFRKDVERELRMAAVVMPTR